MLNSIMAGIVSAMLSTVFADPMFIYSYFRSNERKRQGKKYRNFWIIFNCRAFWVIQIMVFLLTALVYFALFKTFIENYNFGSEIMMYAVFLLSAYCVGTVFHCVNMMWCVIYTPLGDIHNFVSDVARKLTEAVGIAAMFLFMAMM